MSILWFRSFLLASFIVLFFIQGVYGNKDYSICSRASTRYIYPQENQTVYYKNVTLNWSLNIKPSPVTLQISENKNFTCIIIDTLINSSSFHTSVLGKSKEYFWRILSSDENREDQLFSFFKTTTLKIDYHTPCCLQLIPTTLGELPLLYIDNPDFKQYSISIHSLDNFEKVIEKKSGSEYQCIPAYKFPKGRYLIKIQVPEEEINNISEILMTKDE